VVRGNYVSRIKRLGKSFFAFLHNHNNYRMTFLQQTSATERSTYLEAYAIFQQEANIHIEFARRSQRSRKTEQRPPPPLKHEKARGHVRLNTN
jgi:hypothetical protein